MKLFLNGCVSSAAVLLLAAAPQTACADAPIGYVFRHPPKILRYDVVKDEFTYYESAVSPVAKTRPGGDLAYWGNRLRQYRYLGRAGTGGIYEAIDDYNKAMHRDPMKYQYRP